MSESIVKCPGCGQPIDVEKALASQTEEKLRKEFEAKMVQQNREVMLQKQNLEIEQQKLIRLQTEQKELLRQKFEQQKQNFLKEAETKARETFLSEMDKLRTENEVRKKEITDLRKKEVEVLELQQQLKDQKEQLELEMRKQFLVRQNEIENKIKRSEQERNELRFKEYEKKLDDQKVLIEEMKRKAEQGSMQMQGEVQELAIEQYLRESFPLDEISEIKKGDRGADCIQIVHSRHRTHVGKIYYESKRTKEFQKAWVEKLKADMRVLGADICVLITETLPKGQERISQTDGIWICTYEEFKGLCKVLRDTLMRVSMSVDTQENKGDKMHMLYDYLTGNEFRLQVEAIVEGFVQMKSDLDRERRSMEGNWKRREKQIEKVLLNTNFMYNSIRGIAGNAVAPISELDLPEGNNYLIED